MLEFMKDWVEDISFKVGILGKILSIFFNYILILCYIVCSVE